MPKKAITSPKAKAIGPYSAAVEQGDFVFVSGQIPLDAATGKLVEGDIGAQTRQSLENLKTILGAAGLGFGHVVKTTIFLTSLCRGALPGALHDRGRRLADGGESRN
jgi:2-iminobutanoate/2-iminopropanoate deaminase